MMGLSPLMYMANLRISTSIYFIPRATLSLVTRVSLLGRPSGYAVFVPRMLPLRRASELSNYLVKRGYKKDHQGTRVKRGIDRARRMPRANTLRNNQPVNNNRIPFLVTFHPALPNIGEILHRLHPVLKSSRRCQSAIEQMPMVAFMRPKRKKDKIKRSRLLHKFFFPGMVTFLLVMSL